MNQPAAGVPREATAATRAVNAAVRRRLPFDDVRDFDDAERGFIASIEPLLVTDRGGRTVWSLEPYRFLQGDAPDTVNPSLWRVSQINLRHGLFRVTDRVYQVRGFDLSNMSVIEGDSGFIVIDPLLSEETAAAAMRLVHDHLGVKPVKAIIYSHSHVDHFGGVRGVVAAGEVHDGKVRVIAPEGFLEHAVSENVYAGTAMSRRSVYMYGPFLDRGPYGQVSAGLGITTSSGNATLIPPTDVVGQTGQELIVDGVRLVFQYTPGTEAPAEMNFYLPQSRALCMAENVTHNMHNLYTLRGAEVRDANAWARYLDEAVELFGDRSDVLFIGHHWPVWGGERIVEFLRMQRDLYKYLHDETLRLANHGYTMVEIAELVELPDRLASFWANRGYYGSLNHNVKAIYQKYLGWFDANPAHLHPLPPAQAAARYVEFMGGAEAVLAKARRSFEAGEYRWVAEVVNHVVFAQPDNQAARALQAEALEQLGYQAENGTWRNFYLSGAGELRAGVTERPAPSTASPDVIAAMRTDMLLDYLGIRLNGPRAAGLTATINLEVTDTKEAYVLTLDNGVLTYVEGRHPADADVTLATDRTTLSGLALARTTLDAAEADGSVTVTGRRDRLDLLLSLLDEFGFWFGIVTPNPPPSSP